jgi:NADH:ubiquinone oxidoreductase subunit 6 (subunit J)
MSVTLLWWALGALTVIGAVSVLVAREMMRMLLGLGAFLLGLAGLYAWYGFELLAVAELFIYVGGVLVLFLFAITSMGRDREGRAVERRFDVGPAIVSAGVAGVLMVALGATLPSGAPAEGVLVENTASALLGPLLPHFEVVGAVLLVALASALAIVWGGDER